MAKLKSLRVKAFRGIRDTEFPLEGKSLLLWGENGSGKSSVVDALQFLFRGRIDHLEGTQGISVTRHAPHLEMGSDGTRVVGVFDPGSVPVSRSLIQAPTPPPALVPFWEECKRTNFLRRSQLLRFIHDDPSERFRAIGSLIGIESLDGIELAFMRTRDGLVGQVQAEVEGVARIRRGLGQMVGRSNADPNVVLTQLNERGTKLGLVPIQSVDLISEGLTEWLKFAKKEDREKIRGATNVKERAESVSNSFDLKARLEQYDAAYDEWASDREQVDSLSEIDFLGHADRLLSRQQWDTCPLCRQNIEHAETSRQIKERQNELQELSTKFQTFRIECAALSETFRTLNRGVQNLHDTLTDELDPESTIRGQLVRDQHQLSAAVSQFNDSTQLKGKADAPRLLATLAYLGEQSASLVEKANQLIITFALGEAEQSILSLIEAAIELRTHCAELATRSKRLARYSKHRDRAVYLFDSFTSAKRDEVDRVYMAIQSDVRRFYELLHPGEPHRDFELLLSGTRRASAELKINAFGLQRVDPRALTSEGHLDSLGICIFLAFVKTFATDSKFIVLDDVIMSIDSSHRSRVAELLLTEFNQWQMVLTTHDEIWFDEFELSQRAHDLRNAFLNLRITGWSLNGGIILKPYVGRWESIEEKLVESDKRGLRTKADSFWSGSCSKSAQTPRLLA